MLDDGRCDCWRCLVVFNLLTRVVLSEGMKSRGMKGKQPLTRTRDCTSRGLLVADSAAIRSKIKERAKCRSSEGWNSQIQQYSFTSKKKGYPPKNHG